MDRRDYMAETKWYDSVDEDRMVATVTIHYGAVCEAHTDEPASIRDGERAVECPAAPGATCEGEWDASEPVEVPIVFEVCGTCGGRGKHVHAGIDAHGLSREDLDEDPERAESYFGGRYDVTCTECGGRRVVPEIDERKCDPFVLRCIREQAQDDHDYYMVCRAERMMGA